MALTSRGAVECEVEGCGLRDVTFILVKMRGEEEQEEEEGVVEEGALE